MEVKTDNGETALKDLQESTVEQKTLKSIMSMVSVIPGTARIFNGYIRI